LPQAAAGNSIVSDANCFLITEASVRADASFCFNPTNQLPLNLKDKPSYEMKISILILSMSALVTWGQEYEFSTIASSFRFPTGVAVDSLGYVYVADYGNNQIKKIDPDGTVSVLAGSGAPGSADGTGSEAEFREPVDVAVDNGFNVYVADRFNNTIRKITPDGVVTTLAGSPGSPGSEDGVGQAALFKYPHGLAIDSATNIYVADRNNHTIRKIAPGAVVTTIAGSPGLSGTADGTNDNARFSGDGPTGVAVDAAGNLYVADLNNYRIRMITPIGPDWVVSTIAGSTSGSDDGIGPDAKFSQAWNLTVDSAGNVYVADTFNYTIRKITKVGSDWMVTTIGGSPGVGGSDDGPGSIALFNLPFAVTVDPAGNLYIADYQNHAIRKGTPPPAPPGPPSITSIKFISGNVQIDFTSDPADTANLFTLESSSNVGGTYADVSPAATITEQGSGSFRAVVAPSGNRQFYRIKK
jgi:sugar lactone lactonase YvrE